MAELEAARDFIAEWAGDRKSALLITSELSSRLRWMTVLTDAPLKAVEPLENRCGGCTICVDNCPVKAFTCEFETCAGFILHAVPHKLKHIS